MFEYFETKEIFFLFFDNEKKKKKMNENTQLYCKIVGAWDIKELDNGIFESFDKIANCFIKKKKN